MKADNKIKEQTELFVHAIFTLLDAILEANGKNEEQRKQILSLTLIDKLTTSLLTFTFSNAKYISKIRL